MYITERCNINHFKHFDTLYVPPLFPDYIKKIKRCNDLYKKYITILYFNNYTLTFFRDTNKFFLNLKQLSRLYALEV